MELDHELIAVPQKQLMADAKSSLEGRWGLAVSTFLVFYLIMGAASIFPLASVVLGGPLAVGAAIFTLKLARNEDAELNNIFDGFKNFANALAAYLVMLCLIMIGAIFLIVPGVIIGIGLSQTMYIMADDPEIGAIDALKKSWEMMKGYKMDYFILVLRFVPWAILCVFTLFIGFLWLAPWAQTTLANFYDIINGEERVLENDYSKHLVE